MSGQYKALGKWGENYAKRYLEQKGYAIIEQNYRFERNEIDLIAQDAQELVFIEVKTVRDNSFGRPEAKVDPKKQQVIQKAAQGYLYEKKIFDVSCRFDVIGIYNDQGNVELNHLKDAFGY